MSPRQNMRASGGRGKIGKSARSSTDTPLMRQYLEIKRQYPDALLFFRMGDFYEFFFDDAVVAAERLELTLTSRDKNKEDPIPMAGVPHHAVTGYIRRLLAQGVKVAICDQVEDPRTAKGLVKRAVTRLITPGVVLDTDHLEQGSHNFLVAISAHKGRCGLAALDLSTSELRATELADLEQLVDELARLEPKELLHAGLPAEEVSRLQNMVGGVWQECPPCSAAEQKKLLNQRCKQESKELQQLPLGANAAALALSYAERTQPEVGLPRLRIETYQVAEHLQLDEATIQNLELFESLMERRRKGSLIWVLDATCTAMGARQLRDAVGRPLMDLSRIQRRLDAVELLSSHPDLREGLRQSLRQIYDLERLTSRVVMQVCTPRELFRLGASLRQLPQLGQQLAQAESSSLCDGVPQELKLPENLLQDLAQEIEQALEVSRPRW